ncbi:lipopolysaccharide assembly protein A domain [Acidovorax phage Aval]|nr:lipopolysaccharide assembly protein A domain [Acidovorax phage Aval]
MTPVQIVLAVLLVGNIAAGRAWLGARDDVAAARAELASKGQELAGVRGAAEACSSKVNELRTLADKRAQEAASARRAAAGRAADYNRQADQILAAPPAVPGDACASAQVRVDAWLKGRAQP